VTASSTTRVLLVGNPNAGKTTLFNRLTGLRAKTANYAGVTVEERSATVTLGGVPLHITDTPGMYSLIPRADDEDVAVQQVLQACAHGRTLVVVVVDGTQLARNLQLVMHLREWDLPMIVAVTMLDIVEQDGDTFHLESLASQLGVPVVDARQLSSTLPAHASGQTRVPPLNPPPMPADVTTSLAPPANAFVQAWKLPTGATPAVRAWLAQAYAVLRPDQRTSLRVPSMQGNVAADVAAQLVQQRSERAQQAAMRSLSTARAPAQMSRSRFLTHVVDGVALHGVLGPCVLLAWMGLLLWALFSWSAPLMDGIDAMVQRLSAAVVALVPATMPLLRSLLADGVFAGVGNVVAFVPQIAMLFFFLGFLEDSGYLARAAFLLDRLMARVGLHGRAFVPLLSGFACAVPAIMSTRSIESKRDRLVTMLVLPWMSCSARLPVYALIIATVFAKVPPVFGVVPMGVVVMIGMYTLSITATLVGGAVLKRTVLRSPSPPLLLELPPYRWPKLSSLFIAVVGRVRTFLIDAGTTILAITIVLWALFQFPRDDVTEQRFDATLAELERHPDSDHKTTELQRVQAERAQARLQHSVAGQVGHAIEPVIAPLGFDWRIGVGLLASFAAREVMVSTLGLVYGLGDDADETSEPLRERLAAERRADGSLLYTPLSGLSLMVFFVLAMQCMSTFAALKRETGGYRWPVLQLLAMTIIAYTASLCVFQLGRALGLS
jgi:ferrous iron transport protein B